VAAASTTRSAPIVELLHAADAEDRQRRVAGALLAQGCTTGDRVAFALGSSADLICAVLGAARVGLVPVLLNATLTPAERDDLADDARPTVRIFTQDALSRLVDEGAPVDLAPYPLTRSMHYTSGTTGKPKGVTTGLWDDATARAVVEDEAEVWQFDPDDLHLVCSPTYHTPSIRFAGNTLLAGGSLVILSRFDAATALKALRRHRPTTTFMVPTHMERLLQQTDLGADERFDSLRLLAHSGASCPEPVKQAVMARSHPDAVWEFYGSTEAQFTVCPPDDWRAHPGSVGRARAGRRLNVDSTGTIWCETPDHARFSYWDDPVATAAAWRGAWCTVGDLGRLTADGFLSLTGRRHDLIISGGVNVYPAEVENALADAPGVAEVAVFGLPDDEWGQRVCAAYVPSAPADEAETALRAAAASRLAPYKRPKSYFAAVDLPHTATGKLMRRAVPEHLGLDPG
jgi:acyl-CoA synthetase (AMP-forming)/AMP-acid ligase II